MIMRKLLGLLVFLLPLSATAQDYSWETVPMDGSRTAAVQSGKIKVKKSSSAAKVMKVVAEAQPAMAKVKEVIGYSAEALSKDYPESGLSNWTVDTIMEKVAELSGKKVDVGFANFGGIRVDMPKGDILLDDILSELDKENQERLLKIIPENAQVIITNTDIHNLNIDKEYRLIELKEEENV